MKQSEFKQFLNMAEKICEDYSTIEQESDEIEYIWFTPKQLKQYSEYCLTLRKSYNT